MVDMTLYHNFFAFTVGGLLFLTLGTPALAQSDPPEPIVQQGDFVRIRLPPENRPEFMRGVVLGVGPDSLLLLRPQHGPKGVSLVHLNTIRRIDLHLGRNPSEASMVKGAFIGAIVGAALGAVIGAVSCDDHYCARSDAAYTGVRLLSVPGLLVGTVIGWRQPGDRWQQARIQLPLPTDSSDRR